MRTPILALTTLLALLMIPTRPVAGHVAAVTATVSGVVLHAQEAPAPPARVEVQVNHGRGWYVSPVWVAVGAIALVLVIMLIVMASRGGGGTTVVR
jgi:hypothetical protein